MSYVKRKVLGQTWDQVSQEKSLQVTVDHHHLNENGGRVLIELARELVKPNSNEPIAIDLNQPVELSSSSEESAE